MRCQSVRCNGGHAFALGDARGDHPPANRALHTAKCADKHQSAVPTSGDLTPHKEPEKADGPDKANHPAQLPMPPFPPVDHFEIRQLHPCILHFEFVDLLVFGKFALPVCLAQRGNRAGQGAPFGNRQTAVSQTGQAAHCDHHKHQRKEDHQPDLSFIESAVKSIAPVLERGNLVILESTSPVGTTEKMIQWMQEERPDLVFPVFREEGNQADIAVAHCPERVLPGKVVRELVENDRIIGGVTTECAEQVRELYKIFVKGGN